MSLEAGFTIRLRPDLFVEHFRGVHATRGPLAEILSEAFPFINPFQYRGLGRTEVDALASLEDSYLEWMDNYI